MYARESERRRRPGANRCCVVSTVVVFSLARGWGMWCGGRERLLCLLACNQAPIMSQRKKAKKRSRPHAPAGGPENLNECGPAVILNSAPGAEAHIG